MAFTQGLTASLGFVRGVRLHGHRLCSGSQHHLHVAGSVTIGQRVHLHCLLKQAY
ncbi:hypothetical protein ACP70R_033713 [Stipagrostis hirtigluma subsp. patula]